MERIISRADLQLPESSPPSSPELTQISRIHEFEFIHNQELPDAEIPEEDIEDGFSFQLFAGGPTTISKIRLDSPDLADVEPGLLQPNRPSAYYFTSPTSPEEQQNFKVAAISGQDLISSSKIPWPGMSYSWKVTHIPFCTKRQRLLLQSSEQTYAKLHAAAAKRTRPGKKARIAGRIKLAAVKVEQEAAKRAAETKEVLEKEKRIRRNREKKLKKKEKAKAAKAVSVGADAGDAGDEMESEDGG